MPLHRLTSITIGVPNTDEVSDYYTEFGLSPRGDGSFRTTDGGQQLRIVHSGRRRLIEVGIGVDDADDLDRVQQQLAALDVPVQRSAEGLTAHEKISNVRARVTVAERLKQEVRSTPLHNGPGYVPRVGARASGAVTTGRVTPRKLGHVVVGSVDLAATQRFFTEGIGFKVSDYIKDRGAFMRCSTDHHNLLVQSAPVNFLHHTSWQVDDVDAIGRGATAMLEGRPERHVWGLGRHYAGSNFFWYLRDPAGNFSEYYSDMDCIVDDALWTPEVLEGARGFYTWGPPPPPSMMEPEDLASLMTGAHSA